jgi:hypothetical protein
MPTDNQDALVTAEEMVRLLEARDDDLCADAARTILTLSEREARKDAEIERLTESLTPSGDTKAAYHGEFFFTITEEIDGEDVERRIYVPWTTTKEIMAAILARAALQPGAPK